MSGIIRQIQSPLGVMIMLVTAVVFAAITVASSISGQLTAAAVNAAGFLSIIFIIAAVLSFGK